MNRYKTLYLLLFPLFLTGYLRAQNSFYILTGKVVNSHTKLFVNNAHVKIPHADREVITDKNGLFRIAVPTSKTASIIITHSDYNLKLETLNINSDTTITFELEPLFRSFLLGEIEKVADRYNKTEEIQLGMEKIKPVTIKRLPAIAGEKDILKAFTFYPGIQSATEGTTELNVRGGSSDQNLYLLDHSTIYKSSHLLGLLSTFQALSAKEVDFYKAAFPARYGGRLSSVVDVETKEPNLDSLAMEGEIGFISSKILAEIPVVKRKTALMIAVRGTYIDKIAKVFVEKDNFESYNFHDMQAKWFIQFNKKNKITFNYFTDSDKYYFYDRTGKQRDIYTRDEQIWENRILNFNYRFEPNKYFRTSFFAGLTGYEMQLNSEKISRPDSTENFYNRFTSRIRDYSFFNNSNLKISDKVELEFGAQLTSHRFTPALLNYQSHDTAFTINNVTQNNSMEVTAFVDFDFKATDKLRFRLGTRNSNYFISHKNYSFFEPRFLVFHSLKNESSVKFSYSRMSQFLHLLSNSGLGLPIDLWISSDAEIKPGTSNQFSMGYARNLDVKGVKMALNAEVYYKKMKNIVSYLDGYSSHNFTTTWFLNKNSTVDQAITQGKGDAYGFEFMTEKYSGDFTGWISYTFASVKHKFTMLNKGIPFPSNFDRRHNVSLVGNYKINTKYEFSFTWDYGSGTPVTLPLYIYYPGGYNFNNATVNYPGTNSLTLYAQSERNKYRMEAFHRLNLAIRRKYVAKHFYGNFELSIYNLYNRKNPYYYYVDNVYDLRNYDMPSDQVPPIKTVLKSVSVFPVIPSFSVTIKWR